MGNRISISIKQEDQNKDPSNVVEEQKDKKRFTKSRTGIELRSPPKKSLSNTSSYKQGDTYIRAGDHEELCGICNQSFENHSSDFNIDLLYLHNRYGEMLNQVTQMETVSRPFTANSMYSMMSKNDMNPSTPKLNVIAESKYGNFLDSSQNQAGSTWNVLQPPKKNALAASYKGDIEYIKKVERIKLEHYNMRTKLLKYIYVNDLADVSEDRRPSRYHLKCPI